MSVLAILNLARAHWKLAGLALLVLALAVQTVRLGHRSNQLERAQINLNEVRAELKRITTAKNEQAERTSENVEKAETIRGKADEIAKRIEQAPTAPNCATPPQVMGADI